MVVAPDLLLSVNNRSLLLATLFLSTVWLPLLLGAVELPLLIRVGLPLLVTGRLLEAESKAVPGGRTAVRRRPKRELKRSETAPPHWVTERHRSPAWSTAKRPGNSWKELSAEALSRPRPIYFIRTTHQSRKALTGSCKACRDGLPVATSSCALHSIDCVDVGVPAWAILRPGGHENIGPALFVNGPSWAQLLTPKCLERPAGHAHGNNKPAGQFLVNQPIHPKRKSLHGKDINRNPGDNGNHSDSDDDEGNDRRRRPHRREGHGDDSEPPDRHFVACPFYLLDPLKYLRCLYKYELKKFSDVVQHLERCHGLVGYYYCEVCWDKWKMVAAGFTRWRAHVLRNDCQPTPGYECLSSEELEWLKTLPRGHDDMTKYLLMWDTLFEGHERPASIYLQDGFAELAARIRDSGEPALRQNLPQMLRDASRIPGAEARLDYLVAQIMDAVYNPPRSTPRRYRRFPPRADAVQAVLATDEATDTPTNDAPDAPDATDATDAAHAPDAATGDPDADADDRQAFQPAIDPPSPLQAPSEWLQDRPVDQLSFDEFVSSLDRMDQFDIFESQSPRPNPDAAA
ncbi:hypothetical protein S7711_02906 [Stachybotrys chartarum IBT 7711]|uniref:C2H2-type domain-containing protein n=1 Tax=Stachybotrys chartarum (strain CBS 109288 / IBT 7711) TaxID=1280523 RepID=A0A084AHC8_STACB|nr:hypothetical protein S7711_02906 [Stachybotrys chartarum IBT 7711]